jgi:hypothetical protein
MAALLTYNPSYVNYSIIQLFNYSIIQLFNYSIIQVLTAAIAREMFSPLAQLSGSVAKFFDPAALQLIILTTCIFQPLL